MVTRTRYHGPTILRHRTRAQEAREDTTALLLAKMVQIAEQKDEPYMRQMDELVSTPKRAENVIHSLVGLVVQYSEGRSPGPGFLKLCEYLTQRLVERKYETLPGLETSWR